MTLAADTTATVVPCLAYRDALAAIEWLCQAFGFHKHAVYADGPTVHHAQLTFGNGMIMLGSADKGGAWGEHIVQPDEVGMRETQSACVIVADADAHYARAKARAPKSSSISRTRTTAAAATPAAIRKDICGGSAATIRGRPRGRHELTRLGGCTCENARMKTPRLPRTHA